MLAFISLPSNVVSQSARSNSPQQNREEARNLLFSIRRVLNNYYYDPNFKGINIDDKYELALKRIETLDHNWQTYRVLVQFLMDLDDSHTRLILPPRLDHFDYGFSMQMIGDKCYVTSVKKGSDGEAKGLTRGDQIINIGSFTPTRNDMWKIRYVIYKLDPKKNVDLEILKTDGRSEKLNIEGKTSSNSEWRKEIRKNREKISAEPYFCKNISPELIACKLSTFNIEKHHLDKLMKMVGSHQKLILDLRGNSGGLVSSLDYFIGYFFNETITVGESIERKKTKKITVKSHVKNVFNGELTVLVDSRSASAAEIFARVVQIEKRGKVFGDISAGAVMTSFVSRLSALNNDLFSTSFGGSNAMSVSVADIRMKDGGRLEKVGVTPDMRIIPSPDSILKNEDPILAYAASVAGSAISPTVAGTFYFVTQEPDDSDDDYEN